MANKPLHNIQLRRTVRNTNIRNNTNHHNTRKRNPEKTKKTKQITIPKKTVLKIILSLKYIHNFSYPYYPSS